MQVRVMLVEDDPPCRKYIAELLQRDPTIELVGVCETTAQARALYHPDRVDVCVLDLILDASDGSLTIDFARWITEVYRVHPCIIITARVPTANWNWPQAAHEAGVYSYVNKNSIDEKLIDAIHDLRNGGGSWENFKPEIAAEIRNESFTPNQLTPTQRRIMYYLSKGYPAKEICDKLNMGMSAHNKHMEKIREKSGMTSKQLVRWATRWRLFYWDLQLLDTDRSDDDDEGSKTDPESGAAKG